MKRIRFFRNFVIFFQVFIIQNSFCFTKNFSVENIILDRFKCLPSNGDVSFELESQLMNYENIYMTLLASWLAHETLPEYRLKQLRNWGFYKHFDLLKDGYGHRGYVAIHNDFVLLAFRGTESRKDYISNALFFQTNFSKEMKKSNSFIHKGMADTFLELKKQTLKIMTLPEIKKKPIVLAGHSLGGVMATLFAVKLFNEGYDVRHIYTAGMPKIGNQGVQKHINGLIGEKLLSVSLSTDLTPMVPPQRESATIFSKIITKYLSFFRFILRKTVEGTNYEINPGQLFVLRNNAENNLMTIEKEISFKEREYRYFKEISRKLQYSTDSNELLKFIKSRFQSHHPDNYICGLSKILSQ